MKFLDNKIDFTTIELNLSADPTETPKEQAGAMYRAWNGMVGNVKGVYIFFRESFVWIASHLITLLVLVLVGYGVYRMRIFRNGGK